MHVEQGIAFSGCFIEWENIEVFSMVQRTNHLMCILNKGLPCLDVLVLVKEIFKVFWMAQRTNQSMQNHFWIYASLDVTLRMTISLLSTNSGLISCSREYFFEFHSLSQTWKHETYFFVQKNKNWHIKGSVSWLWGSERVWKYITGVRPIRDTNDSTSQCKSQCLWNNLIYAALNRCN